jgi:hypothetical protein
MRLSAVLVSLWVAGAAYAITNDSSIPTFEAYPALVRFSGVRAPPNLGPNDDRWPQGDSRFRETVAVASREGPDFAGAFTIVKIGCGTGCVYIAVVDENTGAVFTKMPFSALNVGYVAGRSEYRGLTYHLDSRLLEVEGWTRNRPAGVDLAVREYYEWTGVRFRLLKRELLRK